MHFLIVPAVTVLGITLTGCGLKAPLYLPEPAIAAETQPAPVSKTAEEETAAEDEASKPARSTAPNTNPVPQVIP